MKLRTMNNRVIIKYKLNQEIDISTWESEKLLWHPSSFRIQINSIVIYIDPIDVIDNLIADFIFITHSHSDHFSINDIMKIIKKETILICPDTLKIDIPEITIRKMKPKETMEIGKIKCESIPAYNIIHPKMMKFLGYVLEIDNKRIYHAGDTRYTKEMKSIKNIDVAMLPIGYGILTMSPKQASKATNEIKPKIVIPMHYELGINQADKFASLLNKEIGIEIMEQR